MKRATFAAIKARVAREDNGLTKHGRFLTQMKKVIKRMKRSRLLYLFSGKCQVPESRGGYSLEDSSDQDEPESDPNDSKLAFEFITQGLPVEDIFPFNVRDICELAAELWGFCKNCTREDLIHRKDNETTFFTILIGTNLGVCKLPSRIINIALDMAKQKKEQQPNSMLKHATSIS